MNPLKRIIKSTMALLASLFLSAPLALGYELIVNDDRITIHAHEVPLQTLMADFSNQTGIIVRMDPAMDPLITSHLVDRPMESALKSMLYPLNHVMQWEREQHRNNGRLRLTEIHIFDHGKKDQMVSLDNDVALDIARNPKDGSFYVKNEILIRFLDGLNDGLLYEILGQFNGKLLSVNRAINLYRIKLPPDTSVLELIEQIKTDPRFESAEPNYAYPIDQPHKYSTRNDIRSEVNSSPVRRHGQAIAVLDSGLLPDKLPENYVLESKNAFNPNVPALDSLGHGTQMVMLAAGYVHPMGSEMEQGIPSNPVISIRVFDKNGFMSSDVLMRSIDFALDHNARVVNMSWGSDTRSDFVNDIINYGASRGLVFVASAGNKPTGKPVYPAAYENVISVGALTPDGKQWENSNFGDFVDGFMPGFANMPVGYMADPGIYAGTSIASAYAATHIATFLSNNPGATKSDILDHLFKKP